MMIMNEATMATTEKDYIQNDANSNVDTGIRQSSLSRMRGITFTPLALSLAALVLTGEGSWDCHFFQQQQGISNRGAGLWTLQDNTGKCQLRYDIIYEEDVDMPVLSARIFSLTIMLLGLALTAALTQALQFHACSWGVGGVLALLFLVSVSTTNIFNLWTMFFLLHYVMCIMISRRFLSHHPVHGGISARGYKLTAFIFGLCSLSSFFTLIVLKSDNFCGAGKSCVLGRAGGFMIGAAMLWAAAATAVLRCDWQKAAAIPTNMATTEPANDEASSACKDTSVRSATVIKTQDTSDEESVATVIEAQDTFDEESVATMIEAQRTFDEQFKTCCFGFRIAPTASQSCQKQCAYWSFRILLGFLVIMYVAIIVLMLGSFLETTSAARAPDTSSNFITDQVCAFYPLDPSQPFETFDTKELALTAGFVVAHCGACGQCSNPGDIRAYVNTRKTVAKSAKKCGRTAILRSHEDLIDCLQDNIGFSRDCTECWADNMVNTANYCVLTCIATKLSGLGDRNNVIGAADDEAWLNECLFCDERQSGTAFVTCSGVARRRLGIHSEIERNPAEQCTNTNIDWASANFDEIFPGVSFPDP